MKHHTVSITVEDGDIATVVRPDDESQLPLLMVGKLVIGFESADAATRFAEFAVRVADMAHAQTKARD